MWKAWLKKIVDGDVPHKLQGKEVIRLDVVSLVQGTGIRGQFEERMQKLMDEIRQREDVILFIDESMKLLAQDQLVRAIWTLEISLNQPWREENSN